VQAWPAEPAGSVECHRGGQCRPGLQSQKGVWSVIALDSAGLACKGSRGVECHSIGRCRGLAKPEGAVNCRKAGQCRRGPQALMGCPVSEHWIVQVACKSLQGVWSVIAWDSAGLACEGSRGVECYSIGRCTPGLRRLQGCGASTEGTCLGFVPNRGERAREGERQRQRRVGGGTAANSVLVTLKACSIVD
jgi:hypothetical protein